MSAVTATIPRNALTNVDGLITSIGEVAAGRSRHRRSDVQAAQVGLLRLREALCSARAEWEAQGRPMAGTLTVTLDTTGLDAAALAALRQVIYARLVTPYNSALAEFLKALAGQL
jgi:hypothetical protein